MLTKLLILAVTLISVASQLILKRAVTEIGAPVSLAGLTGFFAAAVLSPVVYAALLLQVVSYAIWMVVIAHEKVGVAIAVLGSGFYVLMALLAWWIFGEELTSLQWAGIVLISLGVVCMFSPQL